MHLSEKLFEKIPNHPPWSPLGTLHDAETDPAQLSTWFFPICGATLRAQKKLKMHQKNFVKFVIICCKVSRLMKKCIKNPMEFLDPITPRMTRGPP